MPLIENYKNVKGLRESKGENTTKLRKFRESETLERDQGDRSKGNSTKERDIGEDHLATKMADADHLHTILETGRDRHREEGQIHHTTTIEDRIHHVLAHVHHHIHAHHHQEESQIYSPYQNRL